MELAQGGDVDRLRGATLHARLDHGWKVLKRWMADEDAQPLAHQPREHAVVSVAIRAEGRLRVVVV